MGHMHTSYQMNNVDETAVPEICGYRQCDTWIPKKRFLKKEFFTSKNGSGFPIIGIRSIAHVTKSIVIVSDIV